MTPWPVMRVEHDHQHDVAPVDPAAPQQRDRRDDGGQRHQDDHAQQHLLGAGLEPAARHGRQRLRRADAVARSETGSSEIVIAGNHLSYGEARTTAGVLPTVSAISAPPGLVLQMAATWHRVRCNPAWCNGSTGDFDSPSPGSNPGAGAAGPRGRSAVASRYSRRVSDAPPAAVIVLAAGEGTRMKSRLPKVLHELGGRTMLGHVLAAALPLGAARTAVVDRRRPRAGRREPARRRRRRHRRWSRSSSSAPVTRCGSRWRRSTPSPSWTTTAAVLVVPGDTPLLRAETLRRPARPARRTPRRRHPADGRRSTTRPATAGWCAKKPVTVPVRQVVEERDADAVTREITRGRHRRLRLRRRPRCGPRCGKLTTDNAQGEQYLPDVVARAGQRRRGGAGAARPTTPPRPAGVNDRVQLAAAGRVLNERLRRSRHARRRHRDRPGDHLAVRRDRPRAGRHAAARACGWRAARRVAAGAVVGPDCTLSDTEIGADAKVRVTTADQRRHRPAVRRRPVHLPAPRHPARATAPRPAPTSR